MQRMYGRDPASKDAPNDDPDDFAIVTEHLMPDDDKMPPDGNRMTACGSRRSILSTHAGYARFIRFCPTCHYGD